MESDASSSGADTSTTAATTAAGAGGHVDDLLPMALSEPQRAHTLARQVLAGRPDDHDASVANQTLAIVERDAGHLTSALTFARAALRHARRSGPDRVVDVLPTLAATLVYAGRTAEGIRRFAEAEALTPPPQRPYLELRRAVAQYVTGRYDDALRDATAAIEGCRRSGDDLWTARGLNTRCLVRLARGEVAEAERDAREAERLFDGVGQRLESAYATHNQALAAHQLGDLVRALALMDAVTARYQEIGAAPNDLVIDHAQLLLTAGLTAEAREMTRVALAGSDLQPVKRAEILLTAAQAALAEGDADGAAAQGEQATRIFAAQQRDTWAHRARLLALQARHLAAQEEDGDDRPRGLRRTSTEQRRRARRLLRDSRGLVTALEADGAVELPVALLLLGRVARDVGEQELAEASLERAAAATRHGPALTRAAGWLAAALLADLRDDRRALLRACRRGLDAVDEHRGLLGDLELRALASRHGNELAAMAVRASLARGDSRAILWWVERWRATALAAPRVTPPEGAELQRRVAALRDVSRRLGSDDQPTAGLDQERLRLEAEVRRAYRRQQSAGPAGTATGSTGSAAGSTDLLAGLSDLGDTVLLSLVHLDGRLYAFTVADGRVRRHPVGPLDAALAEARFARFTLRRAAYGRPADLDATAARLQRALLGRAPPAPWRRRHVVVVPPADLLTVPWGMLPVFAGTAVAVSPSVAMWRRAQARVGSSGGHVALVTGPGLSTGETEAVTLSPLHAGARALSGAEATVGAALDVLDGARLAHVAAHGTFRADAPMFSSLLLADGPLTVHDLDRLRQPPAAMVLSACDSGNAAPIGSGEALGLVSSLLAMGTSTVVGSVVPVHDRATVDVMHAVHSSVQQGSSLAEGLLQARQAAHDPLDRATAAAFTVWGA